MGKISLIFIEKENIFACYKCNTHLTSFNELVSRAFNGSTGQAFLFNKVYINKLQYNSRKGNSKAS